MRIRLLLFLLAFRAFAQTFSLSGVVTNTRTGDPVRRAVVHLFGGAPHSTFADAYGRFRFEGLPAGTYSIQAEKPEFVFEGRRTIELTKALDDLDLKLTPLGVITGKVVDQNGEPVAGANVVAVRSVVNDGLRKIQTDRTVYTDDRGMYRVWNLRPGKYLIKAAGLRGGTNLYAGDDAPQHFADETFLPSYSGGERSSDTAAPVVIEAGTEARADIAVRMEPAYKIRGSLANFTPRRTVTFELLSGDEDVSTGRVSVNGDTGRFEVQLVASGSYLLRATQDDLAGEIPVAVGQGDVSGVRLALASAVTLKGVVRILNPRPDTLPTRREESRTIRAFCIVNLIPAGRRAQGGYSSTYDGGDELTITDVKPGAYRVNLDCTNGYLQSAILGKQDLLANPMLTIAPGETPPLFEVTVQSGGGRVSGTVTGPPAGGLPFVLLLPQFANSTGPVMITVPPSRTGEGGFGFHAYGLAPGPYIAYAFAKRDDVEYRNPAFLNSLTGGVAVQVEDGIEKTVNLTDIIQ